MTDTADDAGAPTKTQTRRDFLILTSGAMAAMGAAAAIWPLIDSMSPARDVIAAGAPVDIDIGRVQPGQQVILLWRSHPIFIVRRTSAELARLQQPADIRLLSDPNSAIDQQPGYARNWHRSLKPEYLVIVGICTHLGCIPHFEPQPGSDLGPGWPGGYFCPCHGSRYDLAGRVFKGVPAPYNLPVPPYRFVRDTVLRIGENPPGASFDFGSIVQI